MLAAVCCCDKIVLVVRSVTRVPMLYTWQVYNTRRAPAISQPMRQRVSTVRKQDVGFGAARSLDGTEAYADGPNTSQALSGDVNRGAATVGTMSLLLTPLVTDIQWPSMAPLAEKWVLPPKT